MDENFDRGPSTDVNSAGYLTALTDALDFEWRYRLGLSASILSAVARHISENTTKLEVKDLVILPTITVLLVLLVLLFPSSTLEDLIGDSTPHDPIPLK